MHFYCSNEPAVDQYGTIAALKISQKGVEKEYKLNKI